MEQVNNRRNSLDLVKRRADARTRQRIQMQEDEKTAKANEKALAQAEAPVNQPSEAPAPKNEPAADKKEK